MKEVLIIIALTVCTWGFVKVLEARDSAAYREREECSWKVIRAWRDHVYSDKQANRLLKGCGSDWSLLER